MPCPPIIMLIARESISRRFVPTIVMETNHLSEHSAWHIKAIIFVIVVEEGEEEEEEERRRRGGEERERDGGGKGEMKLF